MHMCMYPDGLVLCIIMCAGVCVQIYQEMINNEEVERPPESSNFFQEVSHNNWTLLIIDKYYWLSWLYHCTQAEANPRVQQLIQKHIPILQEYVLVILKQLKECINEVPFGIRWLCKATRALVQEKFPEAEAETINAFVGGFFFLRYINPVIVTPHGETFSIHKYCSILLNITEY